MKRLTIIILILILSLLAVGVSFAAVNWYPTTNLLGGTVGSNTIGAAEEEDATFTVNLSTNSNTTWPSCSNTQPCISSVYDASCGSPFFCANSEFLSVKTVTGSSNPYTLTIKSRNADADGPTCTSCAFAEGAKFDLVQSNVGIEQMQGAIDARGEIAGQVWTGTHDFGGATVEIPNSDTLPGTCTVGQIYIDTDATSTQRLYACESTDTWVVQKGDIGLTGPTGAAPSGQIFLTAAGGWPSTTSGAALPAQTETTTNKVNYWSINFDKDVDEHVQWTLAMPSDWNAGTITATFYWTTASGSSAQTVTWCVKAVSLNNDDAMDTAFGTAVCVADAWIANGDMHISSATSAVTVSNTPSAGDVIQFDIYRDVSEDDVAGDANLIGVMIAFGRN